MNYLIERRFVGNQAQAVAKFLISRKGLSKWMIGEYLGNLQKQFNLQVLQWVLYQNVFHYVHFFWKNTVQYGMFAKETSTAWWQNQLGFVAPIHHDRHNTCNQPWLFIIFPLITSLFILTSLLSQVLLWRNRFVGFANWRRFTALPDLF